MIPSARRLAILGGVPRFDAPIYSARPRVPEWGRFAATLEGLFETRQFSNDGVFVRQLEDQLRDRFGVAFCAAVCNGTIALQVALRSLELSGEVITTPFTFPATVQAIEWIGLTPVFCDIDPETYNLDPGLVPGLVTERTTAILPVHVFGNPCDVVALERVAATHGLKIIYDAAHSFGVSHRGKSICAWGDLSILSFHATKLFHTAEGGAIVGSDLGLRERVALLRNFGIVSENEVRGEGLNGKLSELHAALGLALLSSVDQEIAARGRLALKYRLGLANTPGLRFQTMAPETEPNHAYVTIEVDADAFGLSRDQLCAALRAENIIARKYFWPLCSENVAYRRLPSAQPSQLQVAHRIAQRILCLPLYGELEFDAVDAIVETIHQIHLAGASLRAVSTS